MTEEEKSIMDGDFARYFTAYSIFDTLYEINFLF